MQPTMTAIRHQRPSSAVPLASISSSPQTVHVTQASCPQRPEPFLSEYPHVRQIYLPTRRQLLKLSALTAPPHSPSAFITQNRAPRHHDHPSKAKATTVIVTRAMPPRPPLPHKNRLRRHPPRTRWTTPRRHPQLQRPMNGVSASCIYHSGDGKPASSPPPPAASATLNSSAKPTPPARRGRHRNTAPIDRARPRRAHSLIYEGQHVRPIKDRRIFWNEHNIGIVTLNDFNLNPTPAQLSASSRYPPRRSHAPPTLTPSTSTGNSSKPTAPATPPRPPHQRRPQPRQHPDPQSDLLPPKLS